MIQEQAKAIADLSDKVGELRIQVVGLSQQNEDVKLDKLRVVIENDLLKNKK